MRCKSCLQAIFNGEFCDLVEDSRGILIKTNDERPHYADITFMKTTNAIRVLDCAVGKLVDGIDGCLRKGLKADVHADAARFSHQIQHGLVPHEVKAGMTIPSDITVLEDLQHGPGMTSI